MIGDIMNKILNGKELSKIIKQEVKEKILKISDTLKLVVIQVGDLEQSNLYIRNKQKACEEVGIVFELNKMSESIGELELKDQIEKLNSDPSVTSILIQMPLPKHLNSKIVNYIDPNKDVDGLTDINMIKLINKDSGIIACTPKGIMHILNHYKINLDGSDVVVIGRSHLVGRPLSNLLINEDATVTLCHSRTKNLKEHTKKADIIISAVGKSNLIDKDFIKEDSVLIDVGINFIDGKLIGDINYEDCFDKCQSITPVPGGVGPMTVASLLENVLECYYQQKKTV
jgi:methylenetetrahydrofolate dehydrogenase (NADP+) / methenyltetrahydrofolate cyclohydrolase